MEMFSGFRKWRYLINRLLDKFFQRLFQMITLSVGALFFLFLLIKLILSVAYVQNKLLPLANQMLSQALNTEIHIGSISMDFPDYIVLNDVVLKDKFQVPMLTIKQIQIGSFSYDFWQLFISKEKKQWGARKVIVSHPSITLYKSARTGELSNWALTFPPSDSTNELFALFIHTITIDSLQMQFTDSLNLSSQSLLKRFNPQHFHILCNHLQVSSLTMENHVLHVSIDSLQAWEKRSDLHLHSLKGKFILPLDSIGRQKDTLQLRNISLRFQQSHLFFSANVLEEDLSTLFNAGSGKRFQSVFFPSTLVFEDINAFLPNPIPLSGKVQFQGDIAGDTSRFHSHFLSVNYENGKLVFKGRVSIHNYRNEESIFIQANGKEIIATSEGLTSLLPTTKFPEAIHLIGQVSGKGQYIGFPLNFVMIGDFSTPTSAFQINSQFDFRKPCSYEGTISFKSINFHDWFEIPLGKSVDGQISYHLSGTDLSTLSGEGKGTLFSVELNGKRIEKVSFQNHFEKGKLTGLLKVEDPSITFQSDFIYYHEQKEFVTSTHHFLFYPHHFFSSLFPLRIESRFHLRVAGFSIDSMNLQCDMDYLTLSHLQYGTSAEWGPAHISYMATPILHEKNLNLLTPIAELHLEGHFHINELDSLLQQLTYSIRSLSERIDDSSLFLLGKAPDFQFTLRFTETAPLNRLLKDSLHVANATWIQIKSDSILTLSLKSPYLHFKELFFYHVNVQSHIAFQHFPDPLTSLAFTADSFSTSFSSFLTLSGIRVLLRKEIPSKYAYQIHYQNHALGQEIALKGLWQHDRYTAHHWITVDSSSQLRLFNEPWEILKTIHIHIDTLIHLSPFTLASGEKKITAGSTKTGGVLNYFLHLHQFPMAYLDSLLPPSKRGVNGLLTMEVQYQPTTALLIANGTISDFSYKNIHYGTLTLTSFYNERKSIIESTISISHQSIQQFALSGYYELNNKESPLHFSLTTRRLPAEWFSPFLYPYVEQLKGTLVIDELNITGHFDQIKLLGYAYFKKVSFVTSLFKVPYSLSGLIKINEKEIEFPSLILTDQFQRDAMLSGKITHTYFQDIHYQLNIEVSKGFYLMETTKKDNEAFYGSITIQTGSVQVKGNFDYVSVKGTVQPGKGTIVKLPMSYYEEHKRPSFIHFTGSSTNSPPQYLTSLRKTELKGIDLDLYIQAVEDAEMHLIFDEQLQDMIRTRGKGTLHFQLLSSGEISLFGTYEITSGDYLFTLKNIINKRFFIQPGSKLTWEGNPYSASIDITATYETTASLTALDSTLKGRIPVTLSLFMKGNLQNPTIRLGMDLPALSYDQASGLISQLRHIENDEQELNKQAFSILVFNSFAPIRTSEGTFSASSGVASNVSEFLSNQLTNLLGKNLGQQIGIQLSSSQFNELRMNLQASLFQERVQIERQGLIVGNQTQAPSLGNISIHIRLLPSQPNPSKPDQTQLALILFNRENWGISNSLLSTFRGGGIYLKKDFDKFLDLFKHNQSSKGLKIPKSLPRTQQESKINANR